MVNKEIIDNLSDEDTLLLLRTTSNDKIFYRDVIKGKTKIENIRLKVDDNKEFFPNNTIYDKNGKTRKVPYQIKIMLFAKVFVPSVVEGNPYVERWTWVNSVDRCDWDWFYATYYLLVNKHYTREELYVMGEKQAIRNYKISLLNLV